MQTDSSGGIRCFRLASAVECTATVLMPSSRHARRIRSAISPRLAMTSFSIMDSFDDEQRLAELDRIAVLRHDRGDATGLVGFDLIHHLHRLDNAQHLAFLDFIADLDKRLRAGRG